MLSCVLVASCTCNDANLCKSSSILFPASWKRHKFCKVFNAFLTSIELASQQGASYFSLTSLFEDFFQGISEADVSCLNFLLEFSLNWGHVVVLMTLKKKRKKKLVEQIFVNSMQLLTFECLKWTVRFIRSP